MNDHPDFFSGLQAFTESWLGARKRRRLAQKLKQQSKHWIRDWAEAILWAVCMVLLINQYVFQMYRIPSPSMSGTLEVGDMIFVNKMVYGPELLPGLLKLPGSRGPERGEVVVFEHPNYLSKGPVFTILQQFIYMITLTMVDIDKDEQGQPRVHYLIKRAVAVEGDTLRVRDGEVYFRFAGMDAWTSERDYLATLEYAHPLIRLVQAGQYPAIHELGRRDALSDMGLAVPKDQLSGSVYDSAARYASYYAEMADAYPHDARMVAADRKAESGWYIPKGRIFTMGDNRDNSADARGYGPVSLKKVLGHALFIYWPLNRMRGIR